ncbi:MAG: AraC family transcriptional regulator [Chitinophagaceae bacterium]|nr:MAG: AraC family transcriptional regulator [Chitinophagaceae bacterium]
MKPQFLKVPAGPASSFSVRQDRVPFVNNHLHYHPELELIYIKEGFGTQLVGDHIDTFSAGDVFLLGQNLPHLWSFDEIFFSGTAVRPNVFVAHFTESFWGTDFMALPENLPLRNVLARSSRGLRLSSAAKIQVGKLLEEMVVAGAPRKLLLLQEALLIASEDKAAKSLGSINPVIRLDDTGNDRINTIYQYAFANYQKKISTTEIAAVACMSPHSFCRYFRTATRKTFSQFMIELRVSMACRLLIDNRRTLKQVCFESGFHNFSSFHKYFKLVTGKTPLDYQRRLFPTPA